MPQLIVKPWELGEETKKRTGIPPTCVGDFILAKLAAPKGKDPSDGLVAHFLMSAYYDDEGKKIQTIEAAESAGGYDISFPMGKSMLFATKFRGPKSYHKWFDDKTKKKFSIPAEQFTIEYATEKCKKDNPDWDSFDDITKETYINDYFYSLYTFTISLDLLLPYNETDFTAPVVGMQTKLYRLYTPPKDGEKYGNVIVTKWVKGKESLDGTYREIGEKLATSIYDEWTRRDSKPSIDPTSFVEEDETF